MSAATGGGRAPGAEQMSRRVAVTGVGAVTPLGSGADLLLERWCAGEDGFDDGLARCASFEPRDWLSVKETRRSDRFAQLAVAAADEALARAGWDRGAPYDPFRIACVVGTGIGGDSTFEEQLDAFRDGGAGAVSPLAVPRLMANAAAAAVAMRHGLHGSSGSVATACASGADAVAAGVRAIRAGEADAVVVGGAESTLSPFVQAAFGAMGAVSASGVCRPFDARRDGFVLGEGAGVLVLEREDAARARGASVLGWIRGVGGSSDAFHLTAPDPDGHAAARAIEAALLDAGAEAADVRYVNAHGTATALNDRAETQALKTALGPHAASVPVSSTKSAIGHSLGAAGAIEAVATLLALRAGIAPPTLGYGEPEEGLDLDYVPLVARPLDGPAAGGEARDRDGARDDRDGGRVGADGLLGISSSFGFGGHNMVLALEGEPAS